MTILVLNDFAYVNGGASRVALTSAVALARRGHHVHYLAAVGPAASELANAASLQVHCLEQHEIVQDPNRTRAAMQGIWNAQAESAMRRLLRTLSPASTVVHLHTWVKALSASVVRAALDLGFPVVLTLHDFFTACPTGGFFIAPRQQICHLRPMSAACISTQCDTRSYAHKLWRVLRHAVETSRAGLPGGVRDFITISTLSEEVLKPHLPAAANLHRVPNPIEVEHSAPAEVQRSDVFSCCGRLSPEKGPLLLAEAARQAGVALKFIGDGPQRADVEKSGARVSITGWLPPQEALEHIRASRALVLPSIWYETQGLVVAEAAAIGVPAIVPSTSAAREWVQDGVTGLVFQGGDAVDLSRKLAYLQQEPEAAECMGLAAYRAYWQNPATMTRHCEQLEAVYAGMLQRNGIPQGAVMLDGRGTQP